MLCPKHPLSVVSTLLLACFIILPTQKVAAQQTGDSISYISASYSAPYAAYYAPYALQAVAAYTVNFDQELQKAKAMPRAARENHRADIWLAVKDYPDTIRSDAAMHLKSWRYQFGHEDYITCLDAADPDCKNAIENEDRWKRRLSDGPAFQVWSRSASRAGARCSEVSIAFRGTMGSAADWTTNVRWLTGGLFDDYYRQLRRNIDTIMNRVASLPCHPANGRAQIVAVGHSLGGGLAQFAALATRKGKARIVKVFAFDSSPVTGISLLEKSTIDGNAERLQIDRVYQNGEALQAARSWAQEYPKADSSCRPFVRTVEFSVFQPGTAVEMHSMAGLAREMVNISKIASTSGRSVPRSPTSGDCKLDYVPRGPDFAPVRPNIPAPNVSANPEGPVYAMADVAAPAEGLSRRTNKHRSARREH
jgi:pimeloyl-ACP methyl ester carboxylesterase